MVAIYQPGEMIHAGRQRHGVRLAGGGGDRLGVKLIIDLDQSSDVGDAAANALAMYLMAQSEINAKGFVVDVTNTYAPGATDAINTYYGYPNIPIGANKGAAFDPNGPGSYAQHLAQNFTNDIVSASNAAEGVALYRQLLAAAANSSLVIVALGPLNMLSALLASSADGYSALGGSALVTAKVSELMVMGGDWPNSVSAEWNFDQDKPAANDVVANWPTPIVFFGYTPALTVLIGDDISNQTPVTNPNRKAHELTSKNVLGREAWDAFLLLYAARGLAHGDFTYFTRVRGTAVVNASTGQNTWTDDAGGNHYYLVKALYDYQYKDIFNGMMFWEPGDAAVTYPVVLLNDTFTGSNGTSLDAHAPETGAAWVEASGQFEIQSNRLTPVGTTPSEPRWVAVSELSTTDVQVSLTIFTNATFVGGSGVILRYVDNNNFWMAVVNNSGDFELYKCVAGSFTGVNSGAAGFADGDTIVVRVESDALSIWLNGVKKLESTITEHATATKHGVRASVNTVQMDNIVIQAIP